MNGWTNRATWLIELWFNPESLQDVQSAKEHFETAIDKVPDFLKDFIDSDVNWEELEEQFKEDEEEDEADELVLREDLENHPHYRVEYDLDYWGGDYHKVGQFAFIPEGMELNSVEEAFEKLTGIDRQHIIHYSTDERFRSDGMKFQE